MSSEDAKNVKMSSVCPWKFFLNTSYLFYSVIFSNLNVFCNGQCSRNFAGVLIRAPCWMVIVDVFQNCYVVNSAPL